MRKIMKSENYKKLSVGKNFQSRKNGVKNWCLRKTESEKQYKKVPTD